MRNIGIFGGSFDPPHNAHVDIAELAMKQIPLDLLFFVPSYQSPLRANSPVASARHRLAMVNKIAEMNPNWKVLTFELDQKRPVTSIETVKYLIDLESQACYYLLIGGDQAAKLDQWYKWKELIKLVRIVSFSRDSLQPSAHIRAKMASIPFANQLSSSYVRKLIRTGAATDSMLPEVIEAYIREHRLYQ